MGTWDASLRLHYLAISLKDAPGQVQYMQGVRYEGVTTVVTFEGTSEAQVHREALGAPMKMHLLRRLYNLRGETVLLFNDCTPVILLSGCARALGRLSCSRQQRRSASRRWRQGARCWLSTYLACGLSRDE